LQEESERDGKENHPAPVEKRAPAAETTFLIDRREGSKAWRKSELSVHRACQSKSTAPASQPNSTER
jgi:hypothetical protein